MSDYSDAELAEITARGLEQENDLDTKLIEGTVIEDEGVAEYRPPTVAKHRERSIAQVLRLCSTHDLAHDRYACCTLCGADRRAADRCPDRGRINPLRG
jgi:hypothetical protein